MRSFSIFYHFLNLKIDWLIFWKVLDCFPLFLFFILKGCSVKLWICFCCESSVTSVPKIRVFSYMLWGAKTFSLDSSPVSSGKAVSLALLAACLLVPKCDCRSPFRAERFVVAVGRSSCRVPVKRTFRDIIPLCIKDIIYKKKKLSNCFYVLFSCLNKLAHSK